MQVVPGAGQQIGEALANLPDLIQQEKMKQALAQLQTQQIAQQQLDILRETGADHTPQGIQQILQTYKRGGLTPPMTPYQPGSPGSPGTPGTAGMTGWQGTAAGPALVGHGRKEPGVNYGAAPATPTVPGTPGTLGELPTPATPEKQSEFDVAAFESGGTIPWSKATSDDFEKAAELPAGQMRDAFLAKWSGVPAEMHTMNQKPNDIMARQIIQDFYGPNGAYAKATSGHMTPSEYIREVTDNAHIFQYQGYSVAHMLENPEVLAGLGRADDAKLTQLEDLGILSKAKAAQARNAIAVQTSVIGLNEAHAKYLGGMAQQLDARTQALVTKANADMVAAQARASAAMTASTNATSRLSLEEQKNLLEATAKADSNYTALLREVTTAYDANQTPDPTLTQAAQDAKRVRDDFHTALTNYQRNGPARTGGDLNKLGVRNNLTPGTPTFSPGVKYQRGVQQPNQGMNPQTGDVFDMTTHQYLGNAWAK